MLMLFGAGPVWAADQNQTPPPPPPPNQGQGGQGQGGQGGQGQSGQGEGGLGLWLGRPQSNRPYRGLFGGGVGDTEQLLTLGLNAGGGYDSSVFVDNRSDPTAPVVDPAAPVVDPLAPGLDPTAPVVFGRTHSGFAAGSANLEYSLNRSSFTFSGSGGGALSYYPVLVDPMNHSYFAQVHSGWKMSPKATLVGNYSMSYSPARHLVSLPGTGVSGLGPGNPFDTTVGAQAESYRFETARVDLGYQLTRRVTASVSFGDWRAVSPSHLYDSHTIDLSTRVSMGVAKDLAVYAQYGFATHRFKDELNLAPYHSHNIDAGLAFTKALSLTRHTFLSFGTGTSAISDGNNTHYNLTGNVRVIREIGRTWQAWAYYARDVQFVQTFLQPVLSDTVSGSVSGLLNRRVRFDGDLYLTYGTVGFIGPSDGYRTFHANAGIGIAMTRYLSGGVRYLYTRYSFDNGVVVPLDLRNATDRHGVNAYLSAWLPLYSRMRRP
jgi:hypothetical protein